MLMNELYERERHADFVRQAEQDRLAQTDKTTRKSLYKSALNTLGMRLVEWGNLLQDQVETNAPRITQTNIQANS